MGRSRRSVGGLKSSGMTCFCQGSLGEEPSCVVPATPLVTYFSSILVKGP